LAAGNLRSTPLPRRLRTAADVALLALVGTGSWARVEAGEHYPADVLAGMAIGHFLGAFLNDAFLHSPEPNAGGLILSGGPRGSIGLSVGWRF
jgi:hypothetical protein